VVGARRNPLRRHGQTAASPSVDEVADAVSEPRPNRGVTSNPAAQFPQQAPTPLPPHRFVGAAPNPTRRRHQRSRPAASRARRHGHRHRADESVGWHERGAGELPRDERALLAHGTAGADPRRRTRFSEKRSLSKRLEKRGSPCPSIRLLMPDGRTYRLDQFLGLNQIGRRRPPRQGEPSLLVHVRSRGGSWTDQRPVAVPWQCWLG
jgi:hypothetical protein